MRHPSPVPSDPSEIVAEITDELAKNQLEPKLILSELTRGLSRRRPGSWVASLLNADPTTTLVVLADDSSEVMADYLQRYLAHRNTSGLIPNAGVARQVIDSGRYALFPRIPFDKFVSDLVTEIGQDYAARAPIPVQYESVGLLVVPMHSREATIGTIGVIDWNSRQQLDDDDAKWLQAIADRAGITLDHAMLKLAAVDRLERLAALRSIVLAITSSGDERLTTSVILDQLVSKLRVDAAGLLLPDENDQELVTAAHTGFHSASVPSYHLPVDPELRD